MAITRTMRRELLMLRIEGVIVPDSGQMFGDLKFSRHDGPLDDQPRFPARQRYVSRAHGDVVRYAELYIDQDFLVRLLGLRAKIAEIMPHACQCDDFLYRSVQYLAELMNKTDDLSQMIGQTVCQALCLHLIKKYRSAGNGDVKNSRAPQLTRYDAELLQEYVHSHLADHITLDTLSSLAHMTTHDFLVAFRKSFGTTPAQYVIDKRLRRVRWLLLNTPKDIATIAVTTGFASHSRLDTTFKAHIGLTPHEFRSSRRHN